MKKLILLSILTPLFLSCTSDNTDPILVDIEDDFSSIENPRERWNAYELEDYYIEQKWSCECLQPYGAEILISKNKVVDVNFDNHRIEGKQTNYDSARLRVKTVDEVFDLIDEYELTADSISVDYSPRYGYPTNLFINPSNMIADEEIRYTFRGLKKVIQF
ncbi:MAG: DUF6174 domain-containing protein [Balneola sp.]